MNLYRYYTNNLCLENINDFYDIVKINPKAEYSVYIDKYRIWIYEHKDIILLKCIFFNNIDYCKEISFEILKSIFSNKILNICNEELVIECIISWYESNRDYEDCITKVLELLRYVNWNELNICLCIFIL